MMHAMADLPGNLAQAHEKEPKARGEQGLDSTTAPDPQTTANRFGARMAAVSDQSMALVSSFMNVGTPTAFLCSPRMGISPRCGASPRSAVSSGWGVSAGADEVVGQVYKVAPPSTAVVQLSAPPILSREVKQRSVSTLSLGDENENPINNTMLARYTSEDLMGVFSLPVLTGLHNETPRTADSSWALNGSNAEEGSSFITNPFASGTPRGVDFARLDRFDSGMMRIQSQDLANIIKATNGGFTPRAADSPAVTPRVEAAAAPAHAATAPASSTAVHVPSTAEANTISAPSAPAPSAAETIKEQQQQQHSRVASSSSSTANRSSASTSEEEQEEDLAASGRRFSARNLGKPKRKIVDDYESSDEEYTPSKKSRKGGKKSSPSSSRSSSKSSSGHSHNQRGAHVRGRPEMQETARNGQRHWATEVQELRRRWEDVDCASAHHAFPAQLDIMAKRHIKNQHECLLRSLHIAVAEGMVVPHAFNNAEGKSFLGWTGFDIVPERAGDFRAAIESMFPEPLLENTLHNTFRRAGLVPSSWSEAWLGLASFHYKKPV
jgi:hypothetical protein